MASPAARAATKISRRAKKRSTVGRPGRVPRGQGLFMPSRSVIPTASFEMPLKDKLRIGCSGWGYDDWIRGFYPKFTPKSDYLKLNSGDCDSVEVDSSFYRNPGPATTKGWYKSTPPGLLFSMKMPPRITHEQKPKDVAHNAGWVHTSRKELRKKAGPLVPQ